MNHLVRIFTATGNQAIDKPALVNNPGLSDDLVSTLEAQLLGIRQPGPDA